MKKINFIDSIRQPIITEKATILSEQNKTVFKVHSGANKKSIKKNIEKLFKVDVIKVNIINSKAKNKSRVRINNERAAGRGAQPSVGAGRTLTVLRAICEVR